MSCIIKRSKQWRLNSGDRIVGLLLFIISINDISNSNVENRTNQSYTMIMALASSYRHDLTKILTSRSPVTILVIILTGLLLTSNSFLDPEMLRSSVIETSNWLPIISAILVIAYIKIFLREMLQYFSSDSSIPIIAFECLH